MTTSAETPSERDAALVQILKDASADLLYPSESDEPFDVFLWKATENDALKQLAAQGKKIAPMAESSTDEFFAELIVGDDGERYRNLRRVLESNLANLRVLRIGEIEVQVHLIGKTSGGNWAGLHTVSVET